MKKLKYLLLNPLVVLLKIEKLNYRFQAMLKYFLFILVCNISEISSQSLTYYSDIEPIIKKNCTTCHRENGAGPFMLTSFEDVNKRATFIKKVTADRYMPPFPADVGFRNYHNQRYLSDEEIKKIAEWVDNGKQEGKKSRNLYSTKEATVKSTVLKPDIILHLQKPFIIPGNNKEQWRVFVIPVNNEEELYISGVDFIPKNKKLAHHCRIMIDTTNKLRADDGIEVGEESEFSRTGTKLQSNFWHGWIPGNSIIFYPDSVVKILPKHSDLILNLHYAPSPIEVIETAEVHLYFSKIKSKKIAKTFILDENQVSNPPFFIKHDTIIKFYMRSPIIPADLYLMTVTPHAHIFCKNFKSYAVTPEGDLIPLVKIDHWRFNWQLTYQFEGYLKLPKGSVVYAEAEYDNTIGNPLNPNYPPSDINYGWGTKNEMMNLIFQYIDKNE